MANDGPLDWGVNVAAEDSSEKTRKPRRSRKSEKPALDLLDEDNRSSLFDDSLFGDPLSDSLGSGQESSQAGSKASGRASDRARSGRGSSRGSGGRRRAGSFGGEKAESREEPSEMTPERQERFAKNIVLQQLSMSMKSRQQLAKKLAEKNVPEDVAIKVLDRMEEVHLVNDETFAHMWVESRHGNRKLGKRSLRRELREKGIDEELAQQALENVSEDDERDACHVLVQKKLGVSSPEESTRVQVDDSAPWETRQAQLKEREKQVRRLVSMLMRKGYSGSLAMAVVSEYV